MKYRFKINYWEQCHYKKGDVIEAGKDNWDIPFLANNPDIFEKVEPTKKEIEKLTRNDMNDFGYENNAFGDKLNESIDAINLLNKEMAKLKEEK